MISRLVHGQTRGLKASQRKALDKLATRRLRQDLPTQPEFAQALCALSRELNKAIGALVDRRGNIAALVVGSADRLYLPDLGRTRAGGTRFRGVRLIRTRLRGDELASDDLTDLSRLKLDLVVSIRAEDDGRAGDVVWAHLVPDNPERNLWAIHRERHVTDLHWTFSTFIAELESEFEAATDDTVRTGGEGAMLVYVRTRDDRHAEQNLSELRELCRTAGVEVLETYTQSRPQLDPKFAVGSGALEEIELRALQLGAGLLVFGVDLSPAQGRSINQRTQLRVIDRTQLILDIFAQRAQSRGGKLQVELAQLKYRLPRLSGRGTAMSRLAGGIGGRGPGETRLEIDRRRARDRIRMLEKAIDRLGADRELRRKGRRDNRVPVVAIVGYTNAGKSTLLNTLTQSTVLSEDKLFATLDPTSRRLRLPQEREVVLTDTVGFIRNLPAELREAFRATLEELGDADLLLHVLDASDPNWPSHAQSTDALLRELELGDLPALRVFNKIDRLEPVEQNDLALLEDGIQVSALDRQGVRPLVDALDRWLVERGRSELVPDDPRDRGHTEPDEPDSDAHVAHDAQGARDAHVAHQEASDDTDPVADDPAGPPVDG
ncbi:MAG: GTPase HflX [Deltaproteobacteria bacterium]|nr:MAG: GTPase HflX [Deltaproteobacteria bacterium]